MNLWIMWIYSLEYHTWIIGEAPSSMYVVKASESTDWMQDAFSSNSVSSSELQKFKVIKILNQNIFMYCCFLQSLFDLIKRSFYRLT